MNRLALLLSFPAVVLSSLTAWSKTPPASQPVTYAVVVGISGYGQKGVTHLQFAADDAKAFSDYLISPRGGALSKNVMLLREGDATLDRIRTSMSDVFKKAGPRDTVVIFIAGHGIAMNHGPNRGAYVLAVNSNPENLPASALPMEALQSLTPGPMRAHNVRIFIDACHSGIIGSIASRNFNRFTLDPMNDNSPVVYAFMASGYDQKSYECSNFQHGAFTYFLLKGLNSRGAADQNSGRVTSGELVNFVTQHVYTSTAKQQNPVLKTEVPPRLELADLSLPGIVVPDVAVSPGSCLSLRERQVDPPTNDVKDPLPSDAFSVALREGRILPGISGSAFDMLKQRTDVQSDAYEADRRRLLVALEDAGQQVVLTYLRGEEVPQLRQDFENCEQYFSAAQTLSPSDPFVESRRLFCHGRKLIFDGSYQEAIASLQQSIQLYPSGAYSNNAIGIAYLQSGNFPSAVNALREAVALAPYWVYAKHNLALALQQEGQYSDAIATYRAAALLVPNYAYVPYNLGLLLQKLNLFPEAREAWQESLALAPDLARAWTAIGLSYYLEHRYKAAEQPFQKASSLAKSDTDVLAVRHDLALLRIAEGRDEEAVQLWQENLDLKPTDVPSLIGISDALVSLGQLEAASERLASLVKAKPDYTTGGLLYAKVLMQLNNPQRAAEHLQVLADADPQNADVVELLADARVRLHASGQNVSNQLILSLYRRALGLASTRAERKRIKHKMEAFDAAFARG